jgi:transposase-like protein
LANKESVSALAEEFGLEPSQIHLWVNLLLAQADKSFVRSSGNTWVDKAQAQRIQQLEAKLATKNGRRTEPPLVWRDHQFHCKSLLRCAL